MQLGFPFTCLVGNRAKEDCFVLNDMGFVLKPFEPIFCAIGHIPHTRTRSHLNSEVNVWRGPPVLALETDRKHETANRPFVARFIFYMIRFDLKTYLEAERQFAWFVCNRYALYAELQTRLSVCM